MNRSSPGGRKMALAITLVSAALMATASWAQGEDPGCARLVTGEDTGCSGSFGCANRTGCTFYEFQVVCGGTYQLKSWVTGNASCGHCAACVTIYPSLGGGAVGSCYTDGLPEQCGQTADCIRSCSITLSPGRYRMQVCLVACSQTDYETCCEQGYSYVAHGCVAGGGDTCP